MNSGINPSIVFSILTLRAPFSPRCKTKAMGLCKLSLLLFVLLTTITVSSSKEKRHHRQRKPLSLSFPLTSLSLSKNSSETASLYLSLASSSGVNPKSGFSQSYDFKFPFKYSMALIVSLPVGTPPQTQDMILDTGSQLSWIQCHRLKTPPTASFNPSLSSSFSLLPCNHPLCKPRIPDFTLPTTCDQNRLCHYSYFYADGTLAEGNLVREKLTFSRSLSTPPLILGCAQASNDNKGILGMNLGRLSFASQAKISKFSYCVPTRHTEVGSPTAGLFYLGNNPNSNRFQFLDLLTFTESQRMPNLDPLAYTVPMMGIRIGVKKLNISTSVFRPNSGGSGQTMIDSGSDLTYLVDEAYNKVKEEVVRLVGSKMKKDYVYAGVSDMCFDGKDATEIGRTVGDMVFEFEKGVEIVIEKEKILAEVEGGVHCVGIGRSDMLGIASNIVGNFHQQNLWVEFDVRNRRLGLGKADCSRAT